MKNIEFNVATEIGNIRIEMDGSTEKIQEQEKRIHDITIVAAGRKDIR